jgi:cyclic pyranopterin phosphate synthase
VGGAKLNPAGTVRGNGPAKYYQFPKAKGAFGFITPISDHFCSACNRLALTADASCGRACCRRRDRYQDAAQERASDRELARLFHAAVAAKPEGHTLCRASGFPDFGRSMSQIGG